jgi:hypothetical protein
MKPPAREQMSMLFSDEERRASAPSSAAGLCRGPGADGDLIESKLLMSDTEYMTTIRKRRLSPQPRRALELLMLLASSPHGATEALLVRAHGFDSDMVAGLVGGGLATAERETMKAGAKPIEVVRLHITPAGRKAIER